MEIPNAVISTTSKVWEILLASYKGDLEAIKKIVNECPENESNQSKPVSYSLGSHESHGVEDVNGSFTHYLFPRSGDVSLTASVQGDNSWTVSLSQA
ncbi:MAG TPA: hypothetical protein VFO70_03440 [Chitinophagaceae bacterium]|nr:hypothetical protein [Chitinophagaceae bacterium]